MTNENDGDWVNRAMIDDSLVADLLCSLSREDKPTPLRLGWSVRQRRSRPPTRHHDDDVKVSTEKEEGEPRRASPSTPLSFSGATSGSGGGGVSEESSKTTTLPAAAPPISKVYVRRNETTISKRPRRKKTLAELREEENLLLKEKKHLSKEIETMRLDIEKHKATNERYRRLKVAFQHEFVESRQKQQITVEVLPKTENVEARQSSCALIASRKVKDVENRESGFSVPDLNLLPADGDLETSAGLYGITS